MTEARFHRIAVLANIGPSTLRGFLCGYRQSPYAIDAIRRALAWIDADDVKRGRVSRG